ncbi:MAG: FecCD family ABC transporter permease [Candidatus Oxydemutatoraceae bacterium WSBS_2016_MAG_OTU14]
MRLHVYPLSTLTGLFLLVFLLGICIGTVVFSPLELFGIFYRLLSGQAAPSETEQIYRVILLELRLPRVLFAMFVGASFAGAGAVLQSLFRNPLADPMLIGISAGAATSTIVLIVLGLSHITLMHMPILPMTAFIGSLLIVMLIYRLARRDGETNMLFLLLAGIGINTLAAGFIGFFTVVASDEALRNFTFWMLGSFANVTWLELSTVAILTIPTWFIMLFARQALNVFALGERNAGYLGLKVERWKRLLLASVAMCIGASVAIAGMVAMIGLLTPHVMRMLYGGDCRILIPSSMLGGALFAVLSDSIARTMMAPIDLPISVVTAFIGAPLFFFFMFSGRFSQRY